VYSEYGVDADADGDLESAWYHGGGGTLEVAGGNLVGTVPETSSSSWTTYFAPPGGLTLSNPGDSLRLTWVFTPTGVDDTGNTSQSFRLAIVDTPDDARLTADGSPGSTTYTGYAMFMNMATTLGRSTPFSLMERGQLGSVDLLSSSGNWTSLIDDGNTGDTGYADGVQYTYFFEATRTEEGHLQLVSRMSGGDLGNDGTLEVVFVDETPNTFTFDTFALRPSRADQTADVFSTHLFKVEFIPEPSSFALAGLGLLGVLFARRLRR